MTKQSDIISDSKYLPVLDHGFVGLVDHMGSDAAVVQAARVSYGDGTKTVREDRGLIRYLMRHRHCYHPSMEVLTVQGWKRWDACGARETFLVPDPKTRSYRIEMLDVLTFDADEDMYVFENDRMSYCVTPDHKMWFRGKYQRDFTKVPVQSMSKWGWFDPLAGYSELGEIVGDGNPRFRFIGFFLGDGSGQGNRVTFHLKKERKKQYLRELLAELGLPHGERPSATYDDATVFTVPTPEFLLDWIDPQVRAASKSFPVDRLGALGMNDVVGLFDGLANSDGSVKADRAQLQFSSKSVALVDLFCALAARIGFDAHRTYAQDGMVACTAYTEGRTTLESRASYHRRERYVGKVFCATTSTGLLAVRGGPDKFGFVCGNTSPFEMCEVKLHLKLPIFVMRQLVRHRTASLNEYSGRYSEMTDEFYLPKLDAIMGQAADNKQGRGGEIDGRSRRGVQWLLTATYEHGFDTYRTLLGEREGFHGGAPIYDAYDDFAGDPLLAEDFPGIAREMARIALPLANYSELYWKQDLHNLLHLLKLRADGHAQYEIRVYAEAIYQIVKPLFPLVVEAWEDYVRDARTVSRMEVDLLRELLAHDAVKTTLAGLIDGAGGDAALAESRGLSVRELREFVAAWGLAA